jgi:hypothetical protein
MCEEKGFGDVHLPPYPIEIPCMVMENPRNQGVKI